MSNEQGKAMAEFTEFLAKKPEAEDNKYSKILFTGLDNSGKTSIILSLQRELSQISMLKPTKSAQRRIFEFLGKSIAEWDLGGQKRYRIAYLKEPTKYFDNTSVAIYVIDIQDKARLGEALSYFSDVVKQFKSLEISPLIYIFFHKMDPDYIKENKMRLDGMISDLKDKIAKIVEKEFNVSFLTTTIYDLWTIMTAFSKILLKIYPQSELLDKTLHEFADRIKPCEAILILDANSLIIGEYFENESSRLVLANSTPYFLTLNDSLENSAKTSHKMVVQRGDKVFYFDQFLIEKSTQPLYLLIMKSINDFSPEMIESFTTILKSML